MKKDLCLIPSFLIIFALSAFTGYSQAQCNLLQAGQIPSGGHSYSAGYWFGMMELPFLFISVFFAFLTAYALRGGRYGKGMSLMAWGFLVMMAGHLHMQAEHFYDFNLFKSVLGSIGGSVA